MSADQYEMLRQGMVSYELEPTDYVNIFNDEKEKQHVSDFYISLSAYLSFLEKNYPADLNKITLRANTTKNISARASIGKIVISRGILDYLTTIPQEQLLHVTSDIKLSGKTLSQLTGLWIIAHEYFHIARGHLDLLESLYSDHALGFEYDADHMATAALYTYVKLNVVPGLGRRAAKSVTLFPVFWSIRVLIHTGSPMAANSTHPMWEERLLSMIYRLSELDLSYPSPGAATGIGGEKQYMSEMAMYYESLYSYDVCSGTSSKWLINYLISRPDVTAADHWNKIRETVIQHSKLLCDRINFYPKFGIFCEPKLIYTI